MSALCHRHRVHLHAVNVLSAWSTSSHSNPIARSSSFHRFASFADLPSNRPIGLFDGRLEIAVIPGIYCHLASDPDTLGQALAILEIPHEEIGGIWPTFWEVRVDRTLTGCRPSAGAVKPTKTLCKPCTMYRKWPKWVSVTALTGR